MRSRNLGLVRLWHPFNMRLKVPLNAPLRLLTACALICAPALAQVATEAPVSELPAAESDAGAGPAAAPDSPPAPRVAEERDYERFATLRNVLLAPSGACVASGLRRPSGKVELLLNAIDGDRSETFSQASGPEFSDDSRFLAWTVVPDPNAEEDEEEGSPKRGMALLNLEQWLAGPAAEVPSGEAPDEPANEQAAEQATEEEDEDAEPETIGLTEFEAVSDWEFNDAGTHLLVELPAGDEDRGRDCLVHELATGFELPLGSVSEFAWSDDGRLLAYAVRREDDRGNGLLLLDTASNRIEVLDSEDVVYKALAWRKDSHDLGVLRELATEDDADEDEDTSHVVLAFVGLSGDRARYEYDHTADDAAPDARIVNWLGLGWADDGATLYFGRAEWDLKPEALEPDSDEDVEEDVEEGDDENAAEEEADQAPDSEDAPGDAIEASPAEVPAAEEESKSDEEPDEEEEEPESLRDSLDDPAGVEIWHTDDIDVLPLQKNQIDDEEERANVIAWALGPDTLVELGGARFETVQLFDRGDFAVLLDAEPHLETQRFGPTLHDLYRVELATGARTLLAEGVKYTFANDPTGRHLLYLRDGQFHSVELDTLADRDLTGALDVVFTDAEDTSLTDEKGPYVSPEWAVDGSFALLYGRYEVWKAAPDGSAAERIGDGRDGRVRYNRFELDPDLEGHIDPLEPIYFQLYGDRTKQTALARLDGGTWSQTPARDAVLDNLQQCDTGGLAYTEERFDDPIDVFVCDAEFNGARQVGATHPEFAEFLWGRSELVDFESATGDALQGALFYPAGYKPGRQYPMIVYIYEERSPVLHDWDAPSERSPYDTAAFTQEGYFVFQPDIVYRAQNPGLSAIDCVVPAVQKVLERGEVDPARVGLVGHSWGAYQTAFIVTRTDVFAAGVAGAPLTNMISMSVSNYWNWGQTNTWIFHESQGRMDTPFWEDLDTYVANSPIFGMETWTKPLLVAFGDDDGAVDWQQGIEFYNAARLARKPLVMLVYPGENHGLAEKPNQVDYRYRVLAWFDHHLKGAEAEPWITDGQRYAERRKELKLLERKQGDKDDD